MVHEQTVTTVPVRPEARVRPLVERRVPRSHFITEETIFSRCFVMEIEAFGVHAGSAANERVAVLRRAEASPIVKRSRDMYFSRWPL